MSARTQAQRLAPTKSAGVVLASAFLLALIGLLALTSVSAFRYMRGLDRSIGNLFVVKQAVWCAAAAMFGLVASFLDYRWLLKHAFKILALVWIGLVAVLLVGPVILGARRWLEIGPMSLQVSEFAKVAVILAAARYVTVRRESLGSYVKGFLPALAWLGATVFLIAKEPDLGTSMFILGSGMLMLFLGGLKLTHIVPTFGLVGPLYLWWMFANNQYIRERLKSHAEEGGNDHVAAAVRSMGSGGLFGTGLGEGRAHLRFVNMIESDFLFTVVAEQGGFIGAAVVVLLFVVILRHGMKIAAAAPDTGGFIVAFGITFMTVFQAAVNMSVVTGLVPPKGIGLPFVSYGGSSLLMFGTAFGILANVARQGRVGGLSDADERLAGSAVGAGPGDEGWSGAETPLLARSVAFEVKGGRSARRLMEI